MAITTPPEEPTPDDVARLLAEAENMIAAEATPPAPATDAGEVDGYTDKVRALEAQAAEADMIRAVPTERVLARQQELAEDEDLQRLETAAHARKLAVAGERERAELQAEADSAAAKRRLEMNVNVRALLLSKRRRRWTTIAWTVLGLAMSFTAVNVQKFAAGTAGMGDPQWWVAWGVDPLLSALVVGLLLAKGDMTVLGRPMSEGRGRSVIRWVEIGALGAALLMNVAPELHGGVVWQMVALHVVVPLAGMAAALVLPVVQEHYATAIVSLYDEPYSGPYSTPTPSKYRGNVGGHAGPNGSSVGATGSPTGDLVERARALIADGHLPVGVSASKLRTALGCGTDAARAVRDALTDGA